MFNRKDLKQLAKTQLKSQVKKTIPVSLFCLCLHILMNISSHGAEAWEMMYANQGFGSAYIWTDIIVSGISLVYILLLGVVTLATGFFYLEFAKSSGAVSFKTFISAFSLWAKGILSMLWVSLWTFLWSLLFLIPGIIKSIAYSQTVFIIAENPHISVRKALKISKIITNGYKSELFVMWLSFFGWFLLSCITCGIGFFYTVPYVHITTAHAYMHLKNAAIATGTVTAEDFQ